jgi:hypothetical protein
MVSLERPQPLRDVARDVTLTTGAIGAILTALVGYGMLNATQSSALVNLLGLLPGLATGITAAWAAVRTAQIGEAHVTPIIDPRDIAGRRLVPETEAQPGRHELWSPE